MVRIISIFKLDELKIHFQTYKVKNNSFDAMYNNFKIFNSLFKRLRIKRNRRVCRELIGYVSIEM